ncbi:CaaX prenyl protease Ste24 [Ectocarpus siliculosus]|uniref:CAAX prenyl protease n=1 Tax=Ectocarpus siliculosus TaxID=2880 RepID=D7G4R4_ECTSI|nr:CaaX prenyl protease Ste24 [Ectocarpus siliculosus]|eukprot:CBJ27157.1 CaaX prenyl protease Ste24 [Ectocarpus siliculosus]
MAFASVLGFLANLESSIGLEAFPKYRQEGAEKSDAPFLLFFVGFTLLVYLLETYLDLRQHRNLKAGTPPPTLLEVLKTVDEDNKGLEAVSKVESKFSASQAYGLDKSRFHFFDSTFDLVVGLTTNLLGWMPWLWDVSSGLVAKAGLGDWGGDIPTSLTFVVLTMVLQTLIGLPFSLYSTFVVEAKHGFNKQTLGLFFADKVKSMLLTVVISVPVLSCVLKIIELGGKHFYVYVWAFMFCFSILMLTIVPTVIMPMFNTYSPLEDGELKSSIENLAKRVSFPLTNLFSVDGSKRSAHSNAYFYGFFKNKRIVLYDTLIKQADTNEIVSILGHELGHWKMSHTLQGFVISQTYLLASFCAFGLATELGESLRLSFGYSTSATLITLYLFFAVMWAPVDHLLGVFMNVLSRKNEFEADAYAVKLGYSKGLQSGLVKLQLENLGNMNPDPWYSAFHYSHPPLVERLQAMRTDIGIKRE